MATHKDPNPVDEVQYLRFKGYDCDEERWIEECNSRIADGEDKDEVNEELELWRATAEETVYGEGEFEYGSVFKAIKRGVDSNYGDYVTLMDENGDVVDEFIRWFDKATEEEWLTQCESWDVDPSTGKPLDE